MVGFCVALRWFAARAEACVGMRRGIPESKVRIRMDMFIEILKAFFIGVVEGITEWLPISSTGHMILVDEFVRLSVSPEFLELFLVVIQLGAIMAVLILYFHKLNPFSPRKTAPEKRGTWRLWGMVAIGCVPAAAIGLTLDDFFNEYFYNAWTVAVALIVYGVVFILLERRNRRREAAWLASRRPRGAHERVSEVGPGTDGDDAEGRSVPRAHRGRDRLEDGAEDRLLPDARHHSRVPRVPATIIGGMLCGCSRTAAAEFTFFLAIPVMFGWGVLKLIKYILAMAWP